MYIYFVQVIYFSLKTLDNQLLRNSNTLYRKTLSRPGDLVLREGERERERERAQWSDHRSRAPLAIVDRLVNGVGFYAFYANIYVTVHTLALSRPSGRVLSMLTACSLQRYG